MSARSGWAWKAAAFHGALIVNVVYQPAAGDELP